MIIIGLGSNIGDRERNIKEALVNLGKNPAISVKAESSLYETKPFGYVDQPDFLNAVAVIDTSLSPLELLDVCQAVEGQLGRKREIRWGPRTIDIDILIYNDYSCQTPMLTLPHPGLQERLFVLVPLAELLPDVPLYKGKTASELLSGCPENGIKLYKKLNWEVKR